jgi:DHA1 family bicyclomycin/chloramphenicol resistance-like MFS transporter
MQSSKPIVLTGIMLFTLGFVGMLGPFGTDAYLPALPAMADDLHVTSSRVGLTLAAFTIGMALGQLILGSLSDRIGRRTVLLGGGTVIAIASFAASLAPNVELLIGLCFAMGLVSASGIVGGRAVVADLTHGVGATRPFAILGMTVSIGPILGPIGGALLLQLGGWRAIFVGLAIFAAIATVGIAAFVPESLPREKRHPGGIATTVANAKRILSTRSFLTYAVVLWFSFGMMFAYISTSSFIVQKNLGLPPSAFASVFGFNGVGIIVTSYLTAVFVKRIPPRRILITGVVMQFIAVTSLVTILATGAVTPWLVLPAIFILATAMGFVMATATAMAMLDVRFASGTALALMGSIQFLAATVTATLVSVISTSALVSLTVVSVGALSLVITALVVGIVSGRRSQASAR